MCQRVGSPSPKALFGTGNQMSGEADDATPSLEVLFRIPALLLLLLFLLPSLPLLGLPFLRQFPNLVTSLG